MKKTVIRVKVNIALDWPAPGKAQDVLSGYFEQEVADSEVQDLMCTLSTYHKDQALWDTEIIVQPPNISTLAKVRLVFRRVAHGINDGVRIVKLHMKTFDEDGEDILKWLDKFQKVPGMRYVPDKGSFSIAKVSGRKPIRQHKAVPLSS